MKNREIKFRVWTAIYLKENDYQPVYKMFYPTSFGCISGQFGWSDKGHLDLGSISENNYHEQNHTVLQQYTGLKDKNGKEIYEGDRVKFGYTENRDFFGEVVYFEDRATFGVKTKNAGEDFNDLVDYMQFFEVVGNIFEMPCNPDHNGECLVCDEWLDCCPFDKK